MKKLKWLAPILALCLWSAEAKAADPAPVGNALRVVIIDPDTGLPASLTWIASALAASPVGNALPVIMLNPDTGVPSIPSSGGAGLQANFAVDPIITGANSEANCFQVGGDTTAKRWCIYHDAAGGLRMHPKVAANTYQFIMTDQKGGWFSQEHDAIGEDIDPDAATPNLVYQYVNTKPIGSGYFSLTERGAVTIALEGIVSNQPKAYWATITDADTDALDFHIPVTSKMCNANFCISTLTVRLVGVSKNATPSGNIVFTCAVQAIRPGTDTYVAHSTTGQVTVTLTPATQNRPVAATSTAITINGTVADGAELWGSCEVDAGGTTSTQLTDFRAKATALVQWSTNSRSD